MAKRTKVSLRFREFRRIAIAVALVFVSLPSFHGQAEFDSDKMFYWGIPRIETYFARETGIHGEIRALSNLSNGELAILTSVGVFSFDGSNWERASQVDMAVSALNIPGQKTFVGHNGGISELTPQTDGTYHTNHVTPGDEYAKYVRTPNSLAIARGHCFGLQGTNLFNISPSGTLEHYKLQSWATRCFAIGDEIYTTGGIQSLLNRWDWEKSELVDASSVLNDSVYEWMIDVTPRREGGVWLLTNTNKIIGFDGHKSWIWPGTDTLARHGVIVKGFLESSPGEIAIGTSNQGLLCIDRKGEITKQFSKQQGLDDVNVVAIGMDNQDGLWIATKRSLSRIPRESRTVVFDDRHGLSEQISSIAFFQNRIYLGTETGLYASKPDAKSARDLFEHSSNSMAVYDLYPYDDTLFVAGSYLQAIDTSGQARLILEAGANSVFQPSKYPNLILAGNFQGITRIEKRGGSWVAGKALEGPTVQVSSIMEAKDGTLIGTLGSDQYIEIRLTEDGGSYDLKQLPGFEPNTWTTAATIEGEIYVNGERCLRWDTELHKFEPAPEMQYYVGAPPYGYENVWGTSSEEAYVCLNGRRSETLPRPDKEIVGDISSLGYSIDTRAKCIAIDDQGYIWSGGSFGLVRSSPPDKSKPPLKVAPKLHRFTSLRDGAVFPIEQQNGDVLILNPEQNSLRIEVEFQNFSAAPHNQYQIYINGVDAAWPALTSTPFREITNLSPGKYEILVNGINSNGQTFDSKPFAFYLQAPWYQRPITYFLYVAILFAILFGSVYYYNRAQIKKSRLLQSLVEERTREILQKNSQLEFQAERLEIQNEELAEKTEELTATTETLSQTLQQLQEMQGQLVETARTAGKAEIAINVLHNVGNVLNSINVSINVLTDKVSHSKVENLAKLADLIASRRADIEAFLTKDPRGKAVPDYLIQLSKALLEETGALHRELAVMEEDIEHVKSIINAQQTHAKNQGITEPINLHELCNSALIILGNDKVRSKIEIINEIPENLVLQNDKHRVLDIVLNLISNSQDAIAEEDPEIGVIPLTATVDPQDRQTLNLRVSDNGSGIASEAQDKIFCHGFTTKQDGHGFGLHSCANAAKALGGDLQLSSPGRHRGATATLSLPLAASGKRAS